MNWTAFNPKSKETMTMNSTQHTSTLVFSSIVGVSALPLLRDGPAVDASAKNPVQADTERVLRLWFMRVMATVVYIANHRWGGCCFGWDGTLLLNGSSSGRSWLRPTAPRLMWTSGWRWKVRVCMDRQVGAIRQCAIE